MQAARPPRVRAAASFALAVVALLSMLRPSYGGGAKRVPPFPEGSAEGWIGTPLTWNSLRGQVVLLDVWTFG